MIKTTFLVLAVFLGLGAACTTISESEIDRRIQTEVARQVEQLQGPASATNHQVLPGTPSPSSNAGQSGGPSLAATTTDYITLETFTSFTGAVSASIFRLAREVASLDSSVYDMESSISSVKNSVYDMESSISDLESNIEDMESRISGVKNSVYDMENSIYDLESSIYDLESNIEDLEETVDCIIFEANYLIDQGYILC